MQDALKKFGRYFLLDMIAQGGMAEIFRARQITTEGLGRTLVIKRIQPSYGSNSEFVSMFQSETRVMMNFNHPNVVQLQDFGDEEGQPFIAMEYIEGKSLRYVKDRIVEKLGNFPPDLAVFIISQAAAGLHYAHTFKDKLDGKALNLVHRDISPQNILLSYDGIVKIIDFGIAKASTNSEQTRAGVIKGKPSYLSPEQIDLSADKLDGRSDVFSLGIVLWELLTGRKLFAGENDLATLRMIQNCHTAVRPPSEFNSLVPKELDYIVMRALAKSRDQRYASALEFQRKLQRYLVDSNPDFNPVDVSGEIKQLFANEIVDDRKNMQRLNEKALHIISLLTTDQTAEIAASGALNESMKPGLSGIRVLENTQVDARPLGLALSPLPELQRTPSRPNSRPDTGSLRSNSTGSSYSGSRSVPARAPVKSKGDGSFFRTAALLAGALGVAWTLYGDRLGLPVPEVLRQSGSVTAQLSLEQVLGHQTPVARNPAEAEVRTETSNAVFLQIKLKPGGGRARIRLNGKALSPAGELVNIPENGEVSAQVSEQEAYRLEVEVPGFKSKIIEGSIDPGKLSVGAMGREMPVTVELEPEQYGILKYRSATASANLRVEIGGQSWVYWSNMPGGFELIKLPPGKYRLQFFSLLEMGQVVESFVIEQGQTHELEVTLEPIKQPRRR